MQEKTIFLISGSVFWPGAHKCMVQIYRELRQQSISATTNLVLHEQVSGKKQFGQFLGLSQLDLLLHLKNRHYLILFSKNLDNYALLLYYPVQTTLRKSWERINQNLSAK